MHAGFRYDEDVAQKVESNSFMQTQVHIARFYRGLQNIESPSSGASMQKVVHANLGKRLEVQISSGLTKALLTWV